MGQDVLHQCRGVKDVNLCAASSCKQSQLRTSRWQKVKTTTITAPYSKEKQTTLFLQYVVISKNAYLKILIEIGIYDVAV